MASDDANSILMDTGEEVTIIGLTEKTFKFSFNHTGTGGTAAGTAGNYVVTLTK